MNVLFVVPDFYPNSTGFANASLNLVKAISKYGGNDYRVWVFTTEPLENNEEVKDVNVLRYKAAKIDNRINHIFNERAKYRYLCKIIEENKIDFLFFETNILGYLQYWLNKKYPMKSFVRIHSTADTEVQVFGKHKTINSKIEYYLTRKFMENVPNVVSTSNFYLDFVKHNYLNDNVYTIWNKKSYSVLFNTTPEIVNNKGSVMNNHFMTMGKMSFNGLTQKGITDLLKAVYCLKVGNELPNDFKLTVIGTGTELPKVISLISDLGLKSEVDIIESAPHDKVMELISSSKAIVLLSRYEGQSMFITESISMGKPLLLSDDNGMTDMIDDSVNGFVCHKGDIQDIAEKLKKYFVMDYAMVEKMGNASYAKYKSNYSEEAIFRQFDNMIKFRTR